MKTNIALVGFMGVGKSTIAKGLATSLEKKLIEVDLLIARKAGKSIPQIFQEDGEIAFRDLEISVIKELASQNNLVIDCGGGIILNKINVDRLKENAIIVWLNASPEAIIKRTESDGNGRPLLQGKKKITEIQQIMSFRLPLYEAVADIKMDTSEADISKIVEQISTRVKENADFSPSK